MQILASDTATCVDCRGGRAKWPPKPPVHLHCIHPRQTCFTCRYRLLPQLVRNAWRRIRPLNIPDNPSRLLPSHMPCNTEQQASSQQELVKRKQFNTPSLQVCPLQKGWQKYLTSATVTSELKLLSYLSLSDDASRLHRTNTEQS